MDHDDDVLLADNRALPYLHRRHIMSIICYGLVFMVMGVVTGLALTTRNPSVICEDVVVCSAIGYTLIAFQMINIREIFTHIKNQNKIVQTHSDRAKFEEIIKENNL